MSVPNSPPLIAKKPPIASSAISKTFGCSPNSLNDFPLFPIWNCSI
jgi:hypothetical protein